MGGNHYKKYSSIFKCSLIFLSHKSSFVEVRLCNLVSLLLEDIHAQHACGAVWIEEEALGFHEL